MGLLRSLSTMPFLHESVRVPPRLRPFLRLLLVAILVLLVDTGVAIFDVGAGKATSATTYIGDNSWGLGNLAGDKLVLWGSTPATAAGRTDVDFFALGVTATGTLDTAFGTGGKLVVDVKTTTDNPCGLLVQADGKIVGTGYSDVDKVVQPVMVRFSAAGVLDKDFGTGGVATTKVLAGVTESYNVAQQGDKYITAGYGRGGEATEKVDLVVVRYNANGSVDQSFGTGGFFRLDIAKEDDRARNVTVLPDGRIMTAGSGKKNATNVDAMAVLLTKDGALDKSFGEGGVLIMDLGGPADAWFGISVSPDKKSVLLAGYKGMDATSGTATDDSVMTKISL